MYNLNELEQQKLSILESLEIYMTEGDGEAAEIARSNLGTVNDRIRNIKEAGKS